MENNVLGNISSANASAILKVDTVIPMGIELTGFSTESMWEVNPHDMAEVKMGVDGQMYASYVPKEKEVTISLEAASPSVPYLMNLVKVSETAKTVFPVDLTITVPSIKTRYKFYAGVLKQAPSMPGAGKTLKETKWTFVFGKHDFERY